MIEDTFQKLKSNLELSPSFGDVVSRQHKAVRSVVENNAASVKDTKLIGSLSRQTRIQPRDGDEFDIDILVLLGEFTSWQVTGGVTTTIAMNRVHGAVQSSDRYSKMNPEQDHPTITFEYANGVKVELVPAYLDKIGHAPNGNAHQPAGRAYWIPGRSGSWELADYDYEAEYISAANKLSGGLLIPTVKMLKAVKREHCPALKSYHLEVIAANVVPRLLAEYKEQGSNPTYPLLVADFLYRFDSQLTSMWGIPGSLSPPFVIDPVTRIAISPNIAWLKEQARSAWNDGTDADKHRVWKTIFRDQLPLP